MVAKINNKLTLNKTIILTLLILILTAFVAFSVYKFPSKKGSIVNQTNKNTLERRGINPNPVSIKFVKLNSVWEYNNFAYSVKGVYLTPDIADIGNWRDNYEIGTKNQFIVVEVDVRNKGTSGGVRSVDTTSFLRIKANGNENGPKDSDYLVLKPQEDGKVYRVFVVSINTSEITLLTGLTEKPRVTEIDFLGSEAVEMDGVFLHKTGYSPEYSD